MARGDEDRRRAAAGQTLLRHVAALLELRFEIVGRVPRELFQAPSERRVILAPTHPTFVDPWLLVRALSDRQWRTLAPIRVLATRTFRTLRWFEPLVEAVYRLGGAVELPPRGTDLPMAEKLRGLLDALERGETVAIFPEGHVRRPGDPPVRRFRPGVIYLHRRSAAPIVPIAAWVGERRWPRRPYVARFGHPTCIPHDLGPTAGAAWLRRRTIALYERSRRSPGAGLADG